jgi:uncharacterized protein YdhG (YjbR/CyaY superfamily)|tara:strand:- start:175 stop:615 length:441 start_codon:yes stop_codon:yes gene_type:complete
MQSKANSVEQYLNELPEDRKESLSIVREAIVKNLPTGYVEVMNWGMITYEVPLETFPDTYNGKPLMYVALASQKNHMSVYLMGCYMSPEIRKKFENAYKQSGKKFDAGKSCIRFKKEEDLPLELIGKTIGSMSVEQFIENYLLSRK